MATVNYQSHDNHVTQVLAAAYEWGSSDTLPCVYSHLGIRRYGGGRSTGHTAWSVVTWVSSLTIFTASLQLLVELLEGLHTLSTTAVCLVREGRRKWGGEIYSMGSAFDLTHTCTCTQYMYMIYIAHMCSTSNQITYHYIPQYVIPCIVLHTIHVHTIRSTRERMVEYMYCVCSPSTRVNRCLPTSTWALKI